MSKKKRPAHFRPQPLGVSERDLDAAHEDLPSELTPKLVKRFRHRGMKLRGRLEVVDNLTQIERALGNIVVAVRQRHIRIESPSSSREAQRKARYLQALTMSREGKTNREVGEVFGVGRARAWQLIKLGEITERAATKPSWALTMKARAGLIA